MSLNSIRSGAISSFSASSSARVSKYWEPRRFGFEYSPSSALWGVGVCRLGSTSEKARSSTSEKAWSCPEAVKDSTGLERSNVCDGDVLGGCPEPLGGISGVDDGTSGEVPEGVGPGGTGGPLPEELPPGANDDPGKTPGRVAVPGGITTPLSPLSPSGAGAPADGPVPGEPGGPGVVGLPSGEEGGNVGGSFPGGATVPGWNSAVSFTVDCRIGSISMVNGTDRSLSGYGGMLLSVLTALLTSSFEVPAGNTTWVS